MENKDNLKSNAAYFYINGALNKTFANKHPHEISICHNLHKTPQIDSYNPNAITSLRTDFPYIASLPIPLTSSYLDTVVLNYTEDPALQLVKEKRLWYKKKQKFMNIWRRDKSISTRVVPYEDLLQQNYFKVFIVIGLAKTCMLHNKNPSSARFLVDFAEFNSSDPDINFNSTYNWYYTDGTLDIIEDNDITLLIHNSGITKGHLSFTPIQKCEKGYECHSIMKPSSKKLKQEQPIFQINSCKFSDTIVAGVRQKNSFSLFQLIPEDTSYKIKSINSINQATNFTSSCFDYLSHKTYCLADVNANLSVYDLTTMKELDLLSLEKDHTLLDKWLSVKYYDQNVLLAVNRNTINTIDIRASESAIFCYKPEFHRDKCDEMSVFQFSILNRNLLYVAGSHNVFSYDIRMFKNIQPLQRWTHSMKSTPHLMNVAIDNSNEVLSLASPLHNEVILLTNMHKHKKTDDEKALNEIIVQSFHLPWKPSTIADSVLTCQIQGKMLKPDKFLSRRIKSCNSGLTMISNKDRIYMFLQNTFTDILQQEIRSSDIPFSNDNLCDSFSIWESNDTLPLFATNILNMKPVFSLLKNNISNMPEIKKKCKEKWKRTTTELSEYKDVLAEDLLAPWNLGVLINDGIPSQLDKSETSTKEKVTAWLEKAPIPDDSPNEQIINSNIQHDQFNNFFSQPIFSNHSTEPIITNSQPIGKTKKTVFRKRQCEGF